MEPFEPCTEILVVLFVFTVWTKRPVNELLVTVDLVFSVKILKNRPQDAQINLSCVVHMNDSCDFGGVTR